MPLKILGRRAERCKRGRTPGGPRVPPAALAAPADDALRFLLLPLMPQKFRSAQIGYLLIVAGKNRLDGFFD
jgi:hypothetical protein